MSGVCLALALCVGEGPDPVLAQPAPQLLLVASAADGEVWIYDPATGERLSAVRTGASPHEIAVSPDGREAYVANTGSDEEPGNTVSVIDLRSLALDRTLDLPDPCRPHDLRSDREGSRLWVTCAEERRIAEIESETGELVRWWETDVEGGWMLVAGPDDVRVFVANLEGASVSVIDRATEQVRTTPLTPGQIGIDVSPDGMEVWSASFQSNEIAILDVTSGAVTATLTDVLPAPGRVRFTPDGERVLVVFGGPEPGVAIFDAANRSLEGRIRLDSEGKCITVSPDGRRAYVTHPADAALSIVDLEGERVLGKLETGRTPDGIRLRRGR